MNMLLDEIEWDEREDFLYSNAHDAVDALVEELYDSGVTINKTKITEALKFLCDRFSVDAEHLDESELMVEHINRKPLNTNNLSNQRPPQFLWNNATIQLA